MSVEAKATSPNEWAISSFCHLVRFCNSAPREVDLQLSPSQANLLYEAIDALLCEVEGLRREHEAAKTLIADDEHSNYIMRDIHKREWEAAHSAADTQEER